MPRDEQPEDEPLQEEQLEGEEGQPSDEESVGSQDNADRAADEVSGDSVADDEDDSFADDDPSRHLERLQGENVDLKDQLLRKSADFDNYRKRMVREKDEFAAYANRELLLDIVGIVDDFERAIKSADESQDFSAFHDGIVLIEKQFTSMLERKWRLSRFESVGEAFDPQKHEAMFTEERADHDESLVLEDFQKGYMLHDRVLRPAKVKVSMPVTAESEDEDEN